MLAAAAALQEQGRLEEARERLTELAAGLPGDAEVAYHAASVHDRLGLEAEAVPFYERALAGEGLPDEDRRGALLGLGSTYRVLGRYEEAVATLRRGVADHPDDGALQAFLAMALFHTGQADESLRILLRLLAATSTDPSVQQYRRALELYARDFGAEP